MHQGSKVDQVLHAVHGEGVVQELGVGQIPNHQDTPLRGVVHVGSGAGRREAVQVDYFGGVAPFLQEVLDEVGSYEATPTSDHDDTAFFVIAHDSYCGEEGRRC